ncbi:MAG: glycine--tRNA ligase, partial [Halobacteriales archaeon]|nr:glycine--tRNA ligase [Halobacteriales archaeon]
AQEELPLVPAQGRTREEVKAGQVVRMPVGSAVQKSIVGSEALGYFLWLTYSYLTSIGLPGERLRFRQHAQEEMAHYSADTWDCEFQSGRFGWVEIVGIADRTDFDLNAHSKVSGQRLQHLDKFDQAREVEHDKVTGDRPKVGKHFKQDAAAVMAALAELDPASVMAGQELDVRVGERSVRVPADMWRVERVKEKVAGEYVTPHVIEPSYGVDRILYCLLEASFQRGTGARDWVTLTLPPALAPVSVGVFPLMGKDQMDTTAANLEEDLRRSGVMAWYDDSGSIGKRYARMDEVGTPFCVTVDYTTLEDQTVTLRERDSGLQKRGPRRELLPVLQDLLAGKRRFQDLPWPDVSA